MNSNVKKLITRSIKFNIMDSSYSTSKAIYHVDRIKLLQQNKPIIPTELQIDFEAYCNDNCSFCSYRKEDGYNNDMLKLIQGTTHSDNKPIGKPTMEGRIPNEILLDLPRQMCEAKIPAIEITGGGEPTLHPMFTKVFEMLGEAKREIGLVTNGSTLNDRNVDLIKKYCTWFRVSMDASNQEIHRQVHKTQSNDFEKRLNGIRKIANGKRDDLIFGISFIINSDNYFDIISAAKLYSELGVNNIRFSWMYDPKGNAGLTEKQIETVQHDIVLLKEKYNDTKFKVISDANRIQTYTSKNDFKSCNFQRFVLSVGADSKCYPCCIQKYNSKYAYGDLKKNTLNEIVTSMNTHEFMTKLDPARCYPCWLEPKNKSILAAIEKPTHENFI